MSGSAIERSLERQRRARLPRLGIASSQKGEAKKAYRSNVRGTLQGVSTPRESEVALTATRT